MKYKQGAGLATQINQEHAFKQEQEKLKAKHDIQEDNVIVVEKKSVSKFLLKLVITAIKTVATICLLLLASLGILGLIYPEPREALIAVLETILDSVTKLTGIS